MLGTACPLLAQTAPASMKPTTPESDEVARLRRQLEAQRDGSMRLLIELYAKHAEPLLETISAFTAAEWQARFEKRTIAGPRDLHAVKAELWDRLPPSFKYEVVEDTPERLRFRVTACPLATELKQKGVPAPLGHALNCASDPGIAAGINPRIKFSRTQTLVQGDCCCDHCYELSAT